MDDDARTKKIFSILSHTYPDAKIALSYKSPWELLVAVILSAQCTDIQVNRVTEKLFKKYPTFDSYLQANVKIFEQDIRSTGFFHNKAKNILNAALVIQKIFKGEVPKTMNDLLTLPGVARKTANVVLGNAFGVVEGIAVDTHVIRLSQRLRLVPIEKIGGRKAFLVKKSTTRPSNNTTIDYYKDASPVKIESELMKVIPKKHWFSLTYRLIDHGRAVCKAMRPRCDQCPLSGYCPANTFKQNDS
jgi:endonuclease-3